jgi:hypothetical protein
LQLAVTETAPSAFFRNLQLSDLAMGEESRRECVGVVFPRSLLLAGEFSLRGGVGCSSDNNHMVGYPAGEETF